MPKKKLKGFIIFLIVIAFLFISNPSVFLGSTIPLDVVECNYWDTSNACYPTPMEQLGHSDSYSLSDTSDRVGGSQTWLDQHIVPPKDFAMTGVKLYVNGFTPTFPIIYVELRKDSLSGPLISSGQTTVSQIGVQHVVMSGKLLYENNYYLILKSQLNYAGPMSIGGAGNDLYYIIEGTESPSTTCGCTSWVDHGCVDDYDRKFTRSCSPSNCRFEAKTEADTTGTCWTGEYCDCTEWVAGECDEIARREYTRTCVAGGCGEWKKVEDPTCSFTLCGNGLCNYGETMSNCPSDCWCGNPPQFLGGVLDCSAPSGEYCGDGLCSNGEKESTCPSDCSPVIYCGDGLCGDGEEQSCPSDCLAPLCGDGICNNGESTYSCYSDCLTLTYCGDRICNNRETATTCPSDCTTQGTTPSFNLGSLNNNIDILGFQIPLWSLILIIIFAFSMLNRRK